eukprot:10207265-Alexandrium_andersonii.AAC.1
MRGSVCLGNSDLVVLSLRGRSSRKQVILQESVAGAPEGFGIRARPARGHRVRPLQYAWRKLRAVLH